MPRLMECSVHHLGMPGKWNPAVGFNVAVLETMIVIIALFQEGNPWPSLSAILMIGHGITNTDS